MGWTDGNGGLKIEGLCSRSLFTPMRMAFWDGVSVPYLVHKVELYGILRWGVGDSWKG